ncbi:MAG: FAD-dependent oxidoreductase [Steroidobacteraceae bacterium]|nr:FAD-dependent oxidoreductase [Steroidobacteraceae bacterium]
MVGAGLAGLHAAMLLEEQGLEVQVIEGRRRVGGRVYTLMNVPGGVEAGGEVIGASYGRMIEAARKLKLELHSPKTLAPPTDWMYHIGGQAIRKDEWPTHRANPLSGDDRRILPHQLLQTLMYRDAPLRGRSLDAWLTPEFARWDIPATDYLRAKGHSAETIRLAGIVVHTDRLANTSALHEMRRYHVGDSSRGNLKPGQMEGLQVRGGNSRMPEAMARSLRRPVALGKAAWSIESGTDGAIVRCTDDTDLRARFAVVSMPMPRLRDVLFQPTLPEPLASAVREIEYGLSIQVHMRLREPYWDKDGLPPGMWTDTGIERFTPLDRGPDGGISSVIAFINGAEARRFAFMSDTQCFEYVTAVAARIRPSTRGQLELLTIQSCARDPFGAGDWVYWQPGQIVRFGNHLREGLPHVVFCGEHTAIMQRGMEGAFESGERAALDVLERI